MARKNLLREGNLMIDDMKHLPDIDVPFMVGMVAQAKTFIIDKAMLSLIVVFLGAGVTSGGLMYQINEQGKTMEKMLVKQDAMAKTINEQNVKIAGMAVEIVSLKGIMHRMVRIAQ